MANPDRSVYEPPFDDDLMFDTIDEQEASRGRPLMILLGIAVLLAFAGVVWVAYRQGADHAARNEPPLLAQDPGPTRVVPTETQTAAVPDNPIYKQMGGDPSAQAAPEERLAAAPEEPVIAPPAAAPPAVGPTPDMTVSEIPPASTRPTADAPSAAIPSEIAAEPPPVSPSVDPLPPGASLPAPDTALPPAAEIAPPPAEIAPAEPARPTAAELAAAKAEKDRLAREALAAKKAESARIAEEKRLQQLAAAKPAPAPVLEEPSPSPVSAPPAAATGRDASGRPTLLTPPSFDLTPPQGGTAAAASEAPAPIASAPPPARSAIVADEAPAAPAAAAPAGGAFVVQIGAFNSAEDAAASWKRIQGAYSSALGGASPEIRQTEINGKTKYRLRATGYADRAAANSACNRLKSAGQQCFIAAR